jgi:hypothetical protein
MNVREIELILLRIDKTIVCTAIVFGFLNFISAQLAFQVLRFIDNHAITLTIIILSFMTFNNFLKLFFKYLTFRK